MWLCELMCGSTNKSDGQVIGANHLISTEVLLAKLLRRPCRGILLLALWAGQARLCSADTQQVSSKLQIVAGEA